MANENYQSFLGDVKEALRKKRETALEAIGIFVEGEAITRCTVKTGHLKGSISHKVVGDDTVVIGTNVEYAIYVEKGTGKYAEGGKGRQTPWAFYDDAGTFWITAGQKPKPFLTPAVEDNKARITALAEKYLSMD